jgi:hypothetical protein
MIKSTGLLVFSFLCCVISTKAQVASLNKKEVEEGSTALFDGKTLKGWKAAQKDTLPDNTWSVENGELVFDPTKGHGGDIVTTRSFSDFDLSVDFKISEGGNSGIKYFLLPNTSLGCEFQIIDDNKHADAKLGVNGNRTTASLYDLIPAVADKPYKGAGEWNTARIVSKGQHVEHWLNGTKTLEYERGSDAFKKAISESKFKTIQGFATVTSSPILLQAHGDKVTYRNIKIKEL